MQLVEPARTHPGVPRGKSEALRTRPLLTAAGVVVSARVPAVTRVARTPDLPIRQRDVLAWLVACDVPERPDLWWAFSGYFPPHGEVVSTVRSRARGAVAALVRRGLVQLECEVQPPLTARRMPDDEDLLVRLPLADQRLARARASQHEARTRLGLLRRAVRDRDTHLARETLQWLERHHFVAPPAGPAVTRPRALAFWGRAEGVLIEADASPTWPPARQAAPAAVRLG